ncbi:MAG: DNA polymerase III subunit epsilon [Gammaproteobacteria bacterium]|nr:DNA polymerase III subunit epsilon [Gammaproteobacteria bacterium]
MRQIVLDTETTGLEPREGHRIIEIGCVELINRRITRRNFHVYLNPEREVDAEAVNVHGLSNDFLADKPLFADVAREFLDFIKGAELVIHNAAFDVGFINHEFALLGSEWGAVADHCGVLDTLMLARQMHPGQKNSLDALCRRYEIDNSHRELHGALLDAEILADVYLLMTGGQVALSLGGSEGSAGGQRQDTGIRRLKANREPLRVLRADEAELAAHEARLAAIDKASGGNCVWRKLEAGT